ncbi:MAG: carboxypeptidase-like regulatory domain-containing protein [Planctomycetota bacterium]
MRWNIVASLMLALAGASCSGRGSRAAVPEPEAVPPGGGVLVLELADARQGGVLVPGTFTWITAPSPPPAHSLLPSFRGGGEPLPKATHDGVAKVPVAAGHYTWIRAVPAPPATGAAYARVPPFADRQTVRLELAADTCRLWVTVFATDASGAVPAGSEVALYRRVDDGAPERVASATTDGHGLARFEAVPGGNLLVVAPGASPTDAAPFVQPITVAAGVRPLELGATLLAPPPRHRLGFAISAELTGERHTPPVVALWQRGEGGGALHLAAPPVAEQELVASARVPEGLYELLVVPLGCADVWPDLGVLRVPRSEPGPIKLRVRQRERDVELRLRGVSAELPLRVFAHRDHEPWTGDEQALSIGPDLWPSTGALTWSLPAPVRIVARGRVAWFVAPDPAALSSGVVEVPLLPACRLEVRWLRPFGPAAGVAVQATSAAGEALLALRSGSEGSGPTVRAAWTGEIVLPRGGTATLTGVVDGAPAWTREVQLDAPQVELTVP